MNSEQKRHAEAVVARIDGANILLVVSAITDQSPAGVVAARIVEADILLDRLFLQSIRSMSGSADGTHLRYADLSGASNSGKSRMGRRRIK